MELKHIKELMAAMGRTGTKRMLLKKEGFELELEREENGLFRANNELLQDSYEENLLKNDIERQRGSIAVGRNAGEAGSSKSSSSRSDAKEEDVTSTYITSPMVGTFYTTPSPEDPAFVKPGDKVEKNTVIGVIEAMKVMNEVKAGVSGTVAEILVESGYPVEFGTKLIRII